MMPRYPMMPACLLVLLVLLTGLRAGAEPLHPLLSPAAADSVRTLLRQGKPDTNRVSQLIRLGKYQVYKPGEFTADTLFHLLFYAVHLACSK